MHGIFCTIYGMASVQFMAWQLLFNLWHGICTIYGMKSVQFMAWHLLYNLWHDICTIYGMASLQFMAWHLYNLWHGICTFFWHGICTIYGMVSVQFMACLLRTILFKALISFSLLTLWVLDKRDLHISFEEQWRNFQNWVLFFELGILVKSITWNYNYSLSNQWLLYLQKVFAMVLFYFYYNIQKICLTF